MFFYTKIITFSPRFLQGCLAIHTLIYYSINRDEIGMAGYNAG